MTTDEARELFGYGSWANALILHATECLTPGQPEALAPSSLLSIRDTLARIGGSEWLCLRRWPGESPKSLPRSLPRRISSGAADSNGRRMRVPNIHSPTVPNRKVR